MDNKIKKKSIKNTPKPYIHFLIISLTAILAIFCYSNTLKNNFVWDDLPLIENNPYIRDFSHLKEIFTQHLFYGSRSPSNFYRPMQSLSLTVDYKIWKGRIEGFHISNILFHIFVGVSLYLLVVLISESIFIGAIVSLLFIVHPLFTSIIAYISGRADSLAAGFGFFSFIFYILFRKNTKNIGLIILSIVSFIGAMLSKEGAAIFPFVFLLYEAIFIDKKKRRFNFLTPYFIIIGIYALLRLTVLSFKTPDVITTAGLPLGIRLLTFCKVFFLYLKLLFAPLGLHMERYVEPVFSLGNIYGFFAVSGIALIFYYIYLLYKWNKKLLLFSFSYFFITLLPVSNIVPLNALMAEHWLYIPSSLGFFMILAIFLEKLMKFKYIKQIVILILIVTLIWYSFLTIKRNRDWKDSFTFWSETVKFSPKSYKAHLELGVALAKKGLREEATKEFEKAYELNPADYKALNNLGRIYAEKGDFKKGEEYYQKSLKLNTTDGLTYNGIGNVYLMTNRFDEAIECYRKAITLNPYMASFYTNLGKALKNKGQIEEAKNAFKKALEIDANFKSAIEELKSIN